MKPERNPHENIRFLGNNRWRLLLAAGVLAAVSACGGGEGASSLETPGTTVERAIQLGVFVGNPWLGKAVVGKELQTTLGVVAVDKRNEITALAVQNPTVGGAVPVIDLTGHLRWTPNQADYDGTTVLKLKATPKLGEPMQFDLPVEVNKEVIAFETQLDPNDATYSDPEGKYLFSVTRRDPAIAIQGKVIITELYTKNRMSRWKLNTEGTNETTIIKMLDAPSIVPADSTSTLTTQADYPLHQINYGIEEFKPFGNWGSYIDEYTNVFTTRAAEKVYSYNDGNDETSSTGHPVLNFFTSCNSGKETCAELAKTKSPIVLIHGFSGGDNVLSQGISMKGGGVDTWGGFPQRLISRGHPVFEMQWHTYMRFEEAAGALANFTLAVANYTGQKPIVIAHSFGGIVSHLALEGEGIEHANGQWNKVDYKNQISRLITLNSPLSGINHPSGGADRSQFNPIKTSFQDGSTFQMTRGRDHTDKLIGECYSITCLQAGALFGNTNISSAGYWLRVNSALIAGYGSEISASTAYYTFPRGRNKLVWEGESIKKLQDNASKISVPVLRFVGFQTLGSSDPNYLDGDGLISLMGQSLFPGHFSDDAFNIDSNFNFKFIDNSNGREIYHDGKEIIRSSYTKKYKDLAPGDCFNYKIEVFPYIICARSAHTGGPDEKTFGKRLTGVDEFDFSIANYGNQDSGIRHPLETLVTDTNWVSISPEPFLSNCLTVPKPLACMPSTSTYKGKAIYAPSSGFTLQADSPAKAVLLYMTLTNKTTGIFLNDFSGVMTNDNGQFEVDVASALANRFGADAKLEDYRLTLKISISGYAPYTNTFENIESGVIDLGTISLNPLGAKVTFAGKVIDGQTVSTGIAGATIRMAQGRDLDAASIIQRSDVINSSASLTARKITTDASGNFSVANIRAGEYSVLVRKDGYIEQLQGRVIVSASGQVNLSMLKVLGAGEASITLRWATAGTNVAPDLDSHLLRLDATGAVNYHIFYGNRSISGTQDSLDRDDTDYEGPETVILKTASGFNYAYYVHNFTGSGSIPLSQARVTLQYAGSASTFTPPTSGVTTGRYWRVFDIVNGIVKRCQTNCYFDAQPSGLMTQAGSSPLPALHSQALANLPAKH